MTAKRCQAITQDGTPCQAYAVAGSDYCFHHDPDRAVERRDARSRGGRARHGRHVGPVGQAEPIPLETMADVATLLRRTIDDTFQLENSLQRAKTPTIPSPIPAGYKSGVSSSRSCSSLPKPTLGPDAWT